MSRSDSLTLHLDDHLVIAALQENAQLLSEIHSLLPTSSAARSAISQCLVRLTFVLLQLPIPELDRSQYLTLARFHSRHLADRLSSLRRPPPHHG